MLAVKRQSIRVRPDVADSRKRILLKRYLRSHGILFENQDPTDSLRIKVKNHRRCVVGKPYMSEKEIEKFVEEDHIATNLVAMKQMFGKNAKIGIIHNGTSKKYGTFQELFLDGHVPKKFIKLDQHLLNLKKI